MLLATRGVVWVLELLRAADEKRFLSVSLLVLRDVVKSSSSEVSQEVERWSRKMAVGGLRAEVG